MLHVFTVFSLAFLFSSSSYTINPADAPWQYSFLIGRWRQVHYRDLWSRRLWNAACKDPSCSLLHGSESTCGSLMPAVSYHYLIGIEMHLAFCRHCTPGGWRYPRSLTLPSVTEALIHAVQLGEAFSHLMCLLKQSFKGREKRNERWHHRSRLQKASSCGSPWLIRALFNSWDLSCYSGFIVRDG